MLWGGLVMTTGDVTRAYRVSVRCAECGDDGDTDHDAGNFADNKDKRP